MLLHGGKERKTGKVAVVVVGWMEMEIRECGESSGESSLCSRGKGLMRDHYSSGIVTKYVA